ncbi:sodium:solute symporter family protein [Alkalibacter sp. M17DMB]|nr:sodium:solute symporter family protein [Alkalibacter mobilis]
MQMDVLLIVLLYEILTIVGVGWYLSKREKNNFLSSEEEDSFILAGRGMNTTQVGVTLALTMLGSAHIWGTTANAAFVGATAVWFGLACTVMMVVITQMTGPWVRKLGTSTTPEFIGLLYGKKSRIIISCVMGPLIFGLLMLETQVIGITFAAMTGWDIGLGCLVGGIFGIGYVLFAGMKEVSWLNMINAALMYIALILTAVALFFVLPGGWDAVANHYTSMDQEYMLSIFGTPDILFAFALPTIITTTFFQGISQMGLHTAIAAKNATTVRKSLLIAGPVNGLFCIIPTLIGLAAMSIPQFAQLGPALASPVMLVSLLPKPLVILLLAGFLGALLSTFAMTSLAPATIIVKDLYVSLYKPNASEKEQTKMVRIAILILSVIAIAVTVSFQPDVITAINWIFSWMIPVFSISIIGLFWKRSEAAALITMFLCWALNCLWSMTSFPTIIGMDNVHVAIMSLIVSVISGILLTFFLPGKPGFFSENVHKTQEVGGKIA